MPVAAPLSEAASWPILLRQMKKKDKKKEAEKKKKKNKNEESKPLTQSSEMFEAKQAKRRVQHHFSRDGTFKLRSSGSAKPRSLADLP